MSSVVGMTGSDSCVACAGDGNILGVGECGCTKRYPPATDRSILLTRIRDLTEDDAPIPWSEVSWGVGDDLALSRDIDDGLVGCGDRPRLEVYLTSRGEAMLAEMIAKAEGG